MMLKVLQIDLNSTSTKPPSLLLSRPISLHLPTPLSLTTCSAAVTLNAIKGVTAYESDSV